MIGSILLTALHVLLVALKVIGIALLAVLCLVLLTLALVLFVPIRYRVRVLKEDEPLSADGEVRIIFRLLQLTFYYREKQGGAALRILGKTLKTLTFPSGSASSGNSPSGRTPSADESRKAAAAPGVTDDSGKETAASDAADKDPAKSGDAAKVNEHAAVAGEGSKSKKTSTEAGSSGGTSAAKETSAKAGLSAAKETSPKAGSSAAKETSAKAGSSAAKETSAKAGSSAAKETSARAGSSGRASAPKEKSAKAGSTGGRSIGETISDIFCALCALPGASADTAQQLWYRIDDGIEDLRARADRIKKKIGPLTNSEARALYAHVLREIRYMLRGWKPKKIRGYVAFGLEKPDATGKLCGLLYLLAPDSAGEYRIEPDFTQKLFRTDTTAEGAIRLYRAAVSAVRLLLDPNFRIVLRNIRGRKKPAKNPRP